MVSMISSFAQKHPDFSVIEFLDHSSFDELISIDVPGDAYKFIFNVEQKYWSASMEGTYSTFYDYVGTHMVHPEDQQNYLDIMNPAMLLSHLRESNGIIDFEFRAVNTNGGWRWCAQYVIGGAQHGLPDGIVYCYANIAEAHRGIAGYMGGDDFAILAPADSLELDVLYDDLQEIIADHGVSVGFLPAIGACRSNGTSSIYTLHDEASFACQEAKADYKTRIKFFSSAMVEQTAEDYKTLSAFKDALANDEITFHLQPQCRAVNGRIVGAEALARWIKPDGTRIPPVSYIPTLEKYGFIPDLDKQIWEKVCKWSRESLDKGNPLIPVSVNISPVDIFTMDVPRYFEELIKKYDIPKQAIKVEITESAYGEESDKVRATVQQFRDNGFVVLMDDFGSGFSSLNMLRELNVDMIKLDAYFLRMEENTEKKGMHIIESVVNMAKTMSMPIIVEGVETTEQRAYLMSLGCRYIQGYYFYKPMPTEDFEALIVDPKNIDPQGFSFKFNEEFHIREFLNNDGGSKRFYGAARDITSIANLEQQMTLLSRFVSRTVLFLVAKEDNYVFEVVAHGLSDATGMTKEDIEEELNSGRFYKRLIPKNESVLWKIAVKCVETQRSATQEFRMVGAGGEELNLVVDADYVNDPLSDVKCILSMRRQTVQ